MEFKKCFFLVSTRPFDSLPIASTFNLLPLSQDAIRSVYLPSYQFVPAREEAVIRQLDRFGSDGTIDALLFTMIISATQNQPDKINRSQIFENYFRYLLDLETPADDLRWAGWKHLLEMIADWFSLRSGKRSIGLTHVALMDHLLGKSSSEMSGGAAAKLRQYYDIDVSEEISLLRRLSAVGILTRRETWRFSHDSFEEYFCAMRLVSLMESDTPFTLEPWYRDPEDFLEILRFFCESATKPSVSRFLGMRDLPALWKPSSGDGVTQGNPNL